MTCFRSFLVALLMALFLITGGLPGSAFASEVDLNQIGGTGTCTAGGGTGGEDICTGAVGDTLDFAVTMQIDAAGTNAWHIDLAWDQSLENALDLTAANPNASFYNGFANPSPPPTIIGYNALGVVSVQESNAVQEGHVYGVTGAVTQDFNLTIASTSFRAGTVTFSISTTDETALNLGFFRTDGAAMGNSASQFITPSFGSWVINQVPESGPEPGTSLLMGLGLLGLVMGGRTTRKLRQ